MFTFRGSYLRCNVIGQSIRNQLLIIHETGLGGRCLFTLTRSAIEKVHVCLTKKAATKSFVEGADIGCVDSWMYPRACSAWKIVFYSEVTKQQGIISKVLTLQCCLHNIGWLS